MSQKYGKPTFLPDGSIIYPHKGNPPPDMEGYVRKGFVFRPIFVPCEHRDRKVHTQPCGAVRVSMVCRHSDCVMQGERVVAADCKDCEFAKKVASAD